MKERQSWRDVRDQIQARMLNGTYATGDRLPRDEDIAAELGCARSTVQRAMQDLADAGRIDRRRKGGTQVKHSPVTRATFDIPLIRAEVEAKGARYAYRLLSRDLGLPQPTIAASMELPTIAQALHVRALHLADTRPYVLEDRWINPETVPEILSVDLAAISANEWLVRNRPYSRFDLAFCALRAGPEEADLLQIPVGEALFVTDRTTWLGASSITLVRQIAVPGYRIATRS